MNKKLLNTSIVAAIYVALCLILAPISFGVIQLRLSEILCLLVVEYPFTISGIVVGCFLSNLLFGGLGVIDVIFGTIATLIACLLAYTFRNKKIKGYPIISAIMITITNAIIVGIEFGIIANNSKVIPLSILQIGLSESLVMIVGLLLYKKLINLINKTI